jgi:uncharacterized protein (DUF2141 family)
MRRGVDTSLEEACMKKLTMVLVFLLVGSVAALGAEKAQVEVKIEGLSSDKGRVGAVLFNSADGFPKDSKKAFKSARAQIKDKKATVVFKDLPPGEYAFAVIHDENENGKMDYRFGIPQEGYAFSNNAMGTLGPPGFDKAKFKVEKGTVTQTIKMNN